MGRRVDVRRLKDERVGGVSRAILTRASFWGLRRGFAFGGYGGRMREGCEGEGKRVGGGTIEVVVAAVGSELDPRRASLKLGRVESSIVSEQCGFCFSLILGC